MKRLIRQIIKQTPFYSPLRNWLIKRRHTREIKEWESKGRPAPPPHVIKERTLQHYASQYGLTILVETGTYYGETVEAMKNVFNQIYSIELSKELYEKTKEQFRGIAHIELIHGDSGKELRNVINKIDRPALFWLDGHYSAGVTARGDKDTPIYEELHHIFSEQYRGHVIIIDDARCFGQDPGYPSIKELSDFICSKCPNVEIVVQDDSIRITPKS